MKSVIRVSMAVLGALWLTQGNVLYAQVAPPIQNGQVEIHGALPRTSNGSVDIEAVKQITQAQFARPGVQEVQFRGFTLTDAEQRALFLNSDPNKNVLRQVSTVVPAAGGVEHNVTFRNDSVRARVGREEGQVRARVEGIDAASLTEAERTSLRGQFDRFRLESGNDRGGRGGSDNSGPGSANSGRGGDGGRRGGDDLRVAQAGDTRQEDRQLDRRQDRQADRQQDRREDRRSNAGGDVRGLDRADQVAGEHGREGRDNARAAQMDRPNRIERTERPQRPERPERPQRPERPERPERAGRN